MDLRLSLNQAHPEFPTTRDRWKSCGFFFFFSRYIQLRRTCNKTCSNKAEKMQTLDEEVMGITPQSGVFHPHYFCCFPHNWQFSFSRWTFDNTGCIHPPPLSITSLLSAPSLSSSFRLHFSFTLRKNGVEIVFYTDFCFVLC